MNTITHPSALLAILAVLVRSCAALPADLDARATSSSNGPTNWGLIAFVIGLPIVFVIVIISCICVCSRKKAKERENTLWGCRGQV
jgi:hypothetical protein